MGLKIILFALVTTIVFASEPVLLITDEQYLIHYQGTTLSSPRRTSSNTSADKTKLRLSNWANRLALTGLSLKRLFGSQEFLMTESALSSPPNRDCLNSRTFWVTCKLARSLTLPLSSLNRCSDKENKIWLLPLAPPWNFVASSKQLRMIQLSQKFSTISQATPYLDYGSACFCS